MSEAFGTWDNMLCGARLVLGDQLFRSTDCWYNEKRHLWIVSAPSFLGGGNIIANSLSAEYDVSGGNETLVLDSLVLYNGKPVYRGSGSILFYSLIYGEWIYRTGIAIEEPHHYQALDGSWMGDGCWAGGNILARRHGDTTNFRPLGTEDDSDPDDPDSVPTNNITLTCKFTYWKKSNDAPTVSDTKFSISNNPCGIYKSGADEGNAGRDITVGQKVWRGTPGNERFYKSADKDATGHWRYGRVMYNDDVGQWVVGGKVGAYRTLRSSSEPNERTPTDFFVYDEDGNRTDDPVALTLSYLGVGPSAIGVVREFAEACVWRQ